MILESDAPEDVYYLPSTPPLSASGSATSSPSSYMMTTPTNPIFFGNDSFAGVKEGCEEEVHCEILASQHWAQNGSPPLTPGKF